MRVLDRESVMISRTIGLANGSAELDELLRRADIAMYAAKAAGKGTVRVAPARPHSVTQSAGACRAGDDGCLARQCVHQSRGTGGKPRHMAHR